LTILLNSQHSGFSALFLVVSEVSVGRMSLAPSLFCCASEKRGRKNAALSFGGLEREESSFFGFLASGNQVSSV
jgi:hypothetical protein